MASTLAWKMGQWPTQNELAAAAALASRGYMPPVLDMTLEWLNLDLIPPTDLGALASLATQRVTLKSRVRGNPSPVLVGLNCHRLFVDTSLSTSSTVALVDAMKIGVEEVALRPEDVDMTELVRYGGDGRCRSVTLDGYISDECRLRAKQWASMMGWECQVTRGRMRMWADEDS